jgi:hypothetical protein
MEPEDHTSEAADLAEGLVESVSRPRQDWRAIERSALALAALARQAAEEMRSADPDG